MLTFSTGRLSISAECLPGSAAADRGRGRDSNVRAPQSGKEPPMTTKSTLKALAGMLLGGSTALGASATAVSVASNGGSSTASASSFGNADSTAYAGAT